MPLQRWHVPQARGWELSTTLFAEVFIMLRVIHPTIGFYLLCSAGLLTSCAASKTKPVPPVTIEARVIQPEIPADLLECAVPPPERILTEADASLYIVSLHQAALTCAAKVRALNHIVTAVGE
jgi:hypothetical protein